MNTHRYPLRAATGEQLLQKRTRPAQSMGDKEKRVINDPFIGPNQENSSVFANKKLRRDLSHHQPPQGFKQGGSAFKSSDMKLKKTNPRLASMKAGAFGTDQPLMNQRKGKQMKKIEGKEHQHQFMQYPMMPQYPMQYPAMAPQMMPMGMQFPQPMQQMNPHMVGYHQSPQIAEMQKQINYLSQMTYMQSQMHLHNQHMNHENMYGKQEFAPQMQQAQFRGSYYPQAEQPYGGMYSGFPHQMQGDASETYQEQEEYYEEDQDSQQQNFSQHSQDETNELQADRSDHDVKPTKGSKKTPGGRTKDVSKQSSPKRGDSDSKNQKDDSPARSKRNQSGENVQDFGKQAPNSRMRDHPESRAKVLNNQQRAAQQSRNSKKAKLQEIHDNRNIIDDVNNVRRTTRSMLNKKSQRNRLGQAPNKDSPKKKQPTPTQGKLPPSQVKQKSNSRSPQTSPNKDKTPRKQNKLPAQIQGSQEESSQQITQRETRYSSRLSSAKQSMNVTAKGLTDKQKVLQLQSLKEEIEAADFKGRELINKKNSIKNQRKNSQGRQDSSEKRKTRAKVSAVSKKTPTKDEMLLFGNQQAQSQRSIQEKSEGNIMAHKSASANNPLLKRRKEAQTEIVDRRYDEDMQNRINASKSVYQNDSVDEEDDPNQDETDRMVSHLQQEKNRLQKQIEMNIMDEQQLKDMTILFGIPDEEVQAIKKKQNEYLQKIKDQQLLFGDEGQPGEVNEFSTPNQINVKKEPIKSESQNSEVKMTRVIADNRIIDVDQSKDIKTEQEEILLFNDNSTTQDQQKLIKEEMINQHHQKPNQAQDVNIILEVQKPAESGSQDLKLEKGFQHDPSSTAGMIKQQKLTMEDERLLFSDDPINTSSLAAGPHHKSSTLLPPPSTSPLQQAPQQPSNAQNPLLLPNDLIAHEPDDTFKIDDEAAENRGGRLPNIVQESQGSQDDKGLQDLIVEERPSDHIESMQMQQENLRKQIELLQQQIDQDQKMIKEQNLLMSAQQDASFPQDTEQNEEIEEHQPHEEEPADEDQIMQEHDEREFEVHLEEENNITSNEMQDAVVEQPEQNQTSKDITTLVDHLQLPDTYDLLSTFLSNLDQGLNLLHMRNIKPTFTHLRRFISQQMGRNFTLDHVRQIFFLQPNIYLHHWEFRQEKYDLVFHIPSNINEMLQADEPEKFEPSQIAMQLPITQTLMRARVAHLRKLLLKRVYGEYCKFMTNHSHRLGSQGNSQADHDIFAIRRWPGLFDLNNPRLVPDIPTTGNHLKEQPIIRQRETVQEFVQKNDHKEKIREAMEEANRQIPQNDHQSEQESQQLSDSSDEARRRSMKPTVQTGVKETTMAVVRMKDEMETKAKQTALEQHQKNESQKNTEAHIKCSEQIKQIFSFQQSSTMRLRDVLQKLINSQNSTGTFTSPQIMKAQIETLCKILPDWIKLISANQMHFIKVSKNLNLQQFDISQRIQKYFNKEQYAANLQASQETSSYLQNQKRRERLDSEQARMKQQVMEKGNEPQRMTKSCPPIAGPSQSQDHSAIHQQSAQERSHNQSAMSQKSNSLSHRQQEVQSPNVNNQMPNLSNQQQAQVIKKSAFQPYSKALQSQSAQSHSETPLNHLQKSQTDMHGGLDSEMAAEQQHSLANMGGLNPQYYGGGNRPQNGIQQQQHVIQPSTNSVFKQITPQSQRTQAVNKPNGTYANNQAQENGNNRNGNGENLGSSITYMTGNSCESGKNQAEQMEGGDNVQRANNHQNRFMNQYNAKPNGTFGNNMKQNGIDNLLKQVMQTNGEPIQTKNYSPLKRDSSQQRQLNGQPVSSHQNMFDSNSISASMAGVPQFGNDLYQAMGGSSSRRGYSGSPYGAAPSHNTHHPSLLAINDEEADEMDNGAAVHHHHHLHQAPNLTNFRSRPGEYQGNVFGGHQNQQHHARNRMNSGDRDGGQQFGGRFQGQHGYY